jgi:4-hydroxy-2-oxoheptanedioate aldolase
MRKNPLKVKLRSGQAMVGAFCNLPSPATVEMLGIMGYDFAIIDAEHGPIDVEACEHMIRAADASDIVPVIRVAVNLPQNILRYLDAGALGVQIPMVNTREETERVVASTKYPPEGKRGLAATRASGYGVGMGLPEYARMANEETLVVVQVETREALANVEEIAAVNLVDVVFLGPTDLSAALGHPGQATHPEVMTAIERAGNTILGAGKAAGTIARDLAAYAHWRRLGFQYLATGLTSFIAEAGQAYLQALREHEGALGNGGG